MDLSNQSMGIDCADVAVDAAADADAEATADAITDAGVDAEADMLRKFPPMGAEQGIEEAEAEDDGRKTTLTLLKEDS